MDPSPPKPWLAAVLGVLCNGLGHLYAGRLLRGVAAHALWLGATTALSAATRLGPRATLAAALAVVAVWVGQTIDAARVARRAGVTPRQASSRPLALLAFYAATVGVSSVLTPALKSLVAQTFAVPSGAMIPTVQVGDWVVAAPGRRATRGALVVHEAPKGMPMGMPMRDPMLKRIVAVGGDAVEIRDGALWVNDAPVPRAPVAGPCTYVDRPPGGAWSEGHPCVVFEETLDGHTYRVHCTPGLACGDVERQIVPAGMVWVAGDHRDHSADSRVYGPVPEGMILAEARWVLFSVGPAGVRWDRVGRELR